MAGDVSPRGKRRWWALGLVLSSAAVLLRLAALANNGGKGPETWTAIALGAAIVGLIIWLTLVRYNRGESKLRANAGGKVWVHRCIDPDDPQAWFSVVVSDEAVTVLGRKNRVRSCWPLDSVVDVAVGRIRIGLVDHTGLTITFREGPSASIALPSRTTFFYPRALADTAQREIQRRQAKIRT